MKNFFTSYKSPITVLLAIIIGAGIYTYSNLKTSLFPEITFPKVKIIAEMGDQPVDKMMITVTRPLENAIKKVPGVTIIRSATSRGSCEISAMLDWNADVTLTQQIIQSQISQARNELPADVQLTVEKMNPAILPVMSFALEGNKSQIELTLIANYIVRPFLSQVQGVAGIPVVGGKTKEYWLMPDKIKMAALGITPDAIMASINESNTISAHGYLRDYNRMYLTVTNLGLYSLKDIENIIVKNDGKRVVSIKDIASVKIKEQVEYTKVNANGKQAILVGVQRQPETNVIDLANEITDKVKALNKILPKGVTLQPYYNQADFINESIKSVTDSLWIGLALAILVAIMFLRSLKASLTILTTIPITLALTLVTFHWLGYTLNIMTIGAIAAAIGLIIDDAIVVVEQIHRTHEEHPEETSKVLVGKAIRFLFPSMVGSSLSTIVIFIPFVLMSGVAGAYFKVLTNTMIITLICSFIVTWIGLPVIYLIYSRGKKHEASSKPHAVKKQTWITTLIHKPIVSIIFCVALILSIVFIYPNLETGFLPEMDEGSIVLDYQSPPGTSLEETDRMLSIAEKIILKHPDVANYSRRTGTEMGFFITEQNLGDYLIQLKHDRSKSTEEVISELREQIEHVLPAVEIDFGQVVGDMLGDLMSNSQPIEIKIFGDNPEKLNEIAESVGELVEETEGIADMFNGIIIAGPSLEIVPDIAKLSRYGITTAAFQIQVQTLLDGVVLGSVQEKEQQTNVRLVFDKDYSYGLHELEKEKISMPDGRLIPLEQVASVSLKKGVAEIQRENLQSMAVVTAGLENRDLGSTMAEITAKIKDEVHLPPGYHVSFGGAYAEQQQSFKELLMILITASLLVFTIILFLFKDLRAAFTILILSLLGVSGSFILLFLTNTPLNVSSYTGIIMIVGIIGENAIFTYQQFRFIFETSNAEDAIVFSISTRLRPKLMTALGAIIALMPIALGIGAGAQMHQPLAIAVIGGFIIALPLLLVVLPSVLWMLYKNKNLKSEPA